MSVLSVSPELVSVAAGDLSGIWSAIGEANVLAAGSTLGVVAPAADSVSAELAALFGGHAQTYQTVSTQAQVLHQDFVSTLDRSSTAYVRAEAESASGLGKAHSADGLRVLGSRQHQIAEHGRSRLWKPSRPTLWRPGMSDPRLVTPRHSLPPGSRLWHPGLPGFNAHNAAAPRLFTPHNELMGGVLNGSRGFVQKIGQLIEQIIKNQISYLKLIGTSLVDFVTDELKAILGLPEAFLQSIKDLLHGNIKGSINDILKGFGHLLIDSFYNDLDGALVPLQGYPGDLFYEYAFGGPLADLFHLLQVPAAWVQNLADYLKPLGFGIMGDFVQRIANPLNAFVNGWHLYKDIYGVCFVMGTPMALAFDLIGAPILSLKAFEDSLQAAFTSLISGHLLTASRELFQIPAKTAQAFLFGDGYLQLPDVGKQGPVLYNIHLGGIFDPLDYSYEMYHGEYKPFSQGAKTGGLVPALVSILPPNLQDRFHAVRYFLDGLVAALMRRPALDY